VLAAVCVLVQGIVGRLDSPDEAFLALGLVSNLDISIVWRLVTYGFIHGNIGHLSINLAGLFLIGPRVERIGGRSTVARVFLAGVVAGGVAQLLLAPAGQQGIPLVGASGGIAGLLLWLTTASPDSRTWPIRVSGRNLGRGVLGAEAGLLLVSWLIPDAGFQPIAHACHLGGGLSGWWIARRLLRPSPTLDDLKKERARRESADEPPKLP
jgi:membrane associated rhomboid family serine protease